MASRAGRWLVSLPLGLLFGWITAATLVGFATTLSGIGVLNGGLGEAALGAWLLLAGGLIAAVVIRAARRGPWHGILAYAAAVLWVLVAVVANQYDASLLTTVSAVAAAVIVVLALLSGIRSRSQSQPSGGTARQKTA